MFIESTLLYQLCDRKKCEFCDNEFTFNQQIFGLAENNGGESVYFQEYVKSFDLKKFSQEISSNKEEMTQTCYTCFNCILDFAKKLIAYLYKQHFLIVE